eukprot:15331401-Ditylum_brightwellii.AAC.1
MESQNQLTGQSLFMKISSPATHRTSILCAAGQKDLDSEDESESLLQMEKLILDISLEPSDEKRRKRLSLLIDEELSKPNGAPSDFIDLFSSALEKVGNLVQNAARQRALEIQGQSKEEKKERMEQEAESSMYEGDGEMMSMGKSDIERQ